MHFIPSMRLDKNTALMYSMPKELQMDFFLFWYILSLVIVYYGTSESLKRHYEAKIKEAREEAKESAVADFVKRSAR